MSDNKIKIQVRSVHMSYSDDNMLENVRTYFKGEDDEDNISLDGYIPLGHEEYKNNNAIEDLQSVIREKVITKIKDVNDVSITIKSVNMKYEGTDELKYVRVVFVGKDADKNFDVNGQVAIDSEEYAGNEDVEDIIQVIRNKVESYIQNGKPDDEKQE